MTSVLPYPLHGRDHLAGADLSHAIELAHLAADMGAGTAGHALIDDHISRSPGTPNRRIGRSKEGDNGCTDRCGDVHWTIIVSDEETRSSDYYGKLQERQSFGRLKRAAQMPTDHRQRLALPLPPQKDRLDSIPLPQDLT